VKNALEDLGKVVVDYMFNEKKVKKGADYG
jgi:hypothetical protein